MAHRDTSTMTKMGKTPPPPETIFQLLKLMVTGFVKSLPKTAIRLLIQSLLLFLAIMYVNYYVIAVINDGFSGSPPPGTFWYYLFNLGQNKTAFTMLMALASFLVTSIVSQIRSRGFKGFFHDLFHVFHWTGYCAVKAGRWSLPVLLFSAGAIMPLAWVANNRILFITMAVGQFFAYIAQNRNLTYMAARVGWNDWQRLFRRKKTRTQVNEGVAGFLPLGLLLGFVFLQLIPFAHVRIWSIVMMVVFIGLGILLVSGKTTPKAVVAIVLFLGVNLLWLRLTGRTFADDGGDSEIPGGFGNYIRDPGGQYVIRNGVQPGILGALGGLFGAMVGGARDLAGAAYDAAANAAGAVRDGVRGAYNTAAEAAGNAYDAAANAAGAVRDGVRGAYNTASEAAGNAYDAAVAMAGNAYDAAAETASSALNTAGYVWDVASGTVTGTVGQIVDTGLYVVGGVLSEGGELIYDGIAGGWSLITDRELRNDFFTNVWNDLGQMNDTFFDTTYAAGAYVHDYFTDQAVHDAFWDGVYNVSTSAGDAISNAVSSAWNDPGGAWDAGATLAGNLWDLFSDTVNDPERAYEAIKNATGVRSFANSWDPNRGGWERMGFVALGTFEAYGAITSVQAAGQSVYTRFDDFLAGYSDDAARQLAARNAQGLSDDMARNLGQRGDFIHTQYVDDPAFMTKDSLADLRRIASESGDPIYVRLGNESSVRWIEADLAVPKDIWIKNKTINSIDEILGAKKGSQGLVGYFEPKLPTNMASYTKAEQAAILARFDQRAAEIRKYGSTIDRMIREGKLGVQDGLLIKPGTGGSPAKFIAGDNDLYHCSQYVEDAARASRNSNVVHGSLSRYPQYTGPEGFDANAFEAMRSAGTTRGGRSWASFDPGGGVVSINPDGTITRAYVTNPTFRVPPSPTTPVVYGVGETVKAGVQ